MPSATPDAPSSRRSRHRRDGRGEDHGTPAAASSSSRSHARPRTPTLPEYERPSASLNPAGQRALSGLLQSSALRHLKIHLQQAAEKLTETAGEANDRATDARVRYERQKQRKRSENGNGGGSKKKRKAASETDAGEGSDDRGDNENEEEEEEEGEEDSEAEDDDNDEETVKLSRLEERVKEVTEQLEEQMREVVDAEVKLDGLTSVVEELGKEAEDAAAAQRQSERRNRRNGRRRRGHDDDDDEEMADPDEGEEDEDYEESQEIRDDSQTQPPTQKLQDKLRESNSRWERQSLIQKYSTNNAYIGFYRMIHDAKHPGDDMPPLPHPSTWFSHLEDPNNPPQPPAAAAAAATTTTDDDDDESMPRRTRRAADRPRSASPANSDEIAIERERISLKCPLTLLFFTDPVTSTKCPHSFERHAIEDMINRSSTTTAVDSDQHGGRHNRGRRIKCIQCPVCSVVLTVNDLKRDPVLLRRVRRAEAALQQDDEDDDFEVDASSGRRRKGGRKSGFTVTSDDDDDQDAGNHEKIRIGAAETIRIKRERSRFSSRAPQHHEDIEDE